jgi:hypothetical protein
LKAGFRAGAGHADRGQAAAINESIAKGTATYVGWLNSDDMLLSGGLKRLVDAPGRNPSAPAAHGGLELCGGNGRQTIGLGRAFQASAPCLAMHRLTARNTNIIRRSASEAVGGLDESLLMAIDYDLWWRLYNKFAPLEYVDEFVALNRDHADTNTNTQRQLHYREARAIVRKYHGRVPMKWWLGQPYAVWLKAVANAFQRS